MGEKKPQLPQNHSQLCPQPQSKALKASPAVPFNQFLRRRLLVEAVERKMADLTERERAVMRLVIEGLPNKLIADQLDISVRTVEVHRARVFDKMNVKSAVELANVLQQR